MIYDDNGSGKPDTKLGEATFAGITAEEYYRWADFSTPISLTASTQYHMVFCRTDEGVGDFYETRVGQDKYGDAQYDYYQYGDALASLTAETGMDLLFRLFKDEATVNNHFKITSLAAKDISDYPSFEYWIKSNKAGGSWLQVSMGESALGEITANPTIASTWNAIAHDLSSVDPDDRDAIAYFGFKILDADPVANPSVTEHGKIWLWVDYIRAAKDKQIKMKFPDQVVTFYPQDPGDGYITLFPHAFNSQVQGDWEFDINANQIFNGWAHNSTTNNGDAIDWKYFMAAGTYTLKFFSAKHENQGIIDISIDGVEVASFDTYASSLEPNKIFSQTGIEIKESGIKTIMVKVDGKNASSTDYVCRISAITLFRPS